MEDSMGRLTETKKKNNNNNVRRAWQVHHVVLFILLLVPLLMPIIGQEPAGAWTRDLVATPPLMGSPLQVIESRMRTGRLQRFESRMLDSPIQLIGSPFGPYRFATLPNFYDLRATRRAVSTLPAMVQIPQGMLLLFPSYVVPFSATYVLPPSSAIVEESTTAVPSKPPAPPKFFSARCGQFIEITIPVETSLSDEENKPC
jgi:hypothetical protein